jgi:hypothetical protein
MSFISFKGSKNYIQVQLDPDSDGKEHKHFFFPITGRKNEFGTNTDLCPHIDCIVHRIMES